MSQDLKEHYEDLYVFITYPEPSQNTIFPLTLLTEDSRELLFELIEEGTISSFKKKYITLQFQFRRGLIAIDLNNQPNFKIIHSHIMNLPAESINEYLNEYKILGAMRQKQVSEEAPHEIPSEELDNKLDYSQEDIELDD